ncbi:pyridoxamine 5'-phosphate oxidase family protein [Geodermatophilus sp. SYSU D00697]
MPTTHEDPVLEVLGHDECHGLLTTARTGRLGFTRNALPAIQPVAYRLHDGAVVIPAHADSDLVAGARGTIVAFETGCYDELGRGWSVSVVGPARLVTDPTGIAALDALPWTRPATAPDRCYVAVLVRLLHGWRAVPAGRLGPSGPSTGPATT